VSYGTFTSTEHFADLGKLNLHMVVQFRLKPIYTTVPVAVTNNAQFKSGQNQLKNNNIALLI